MQEYRFLNDGANPVIESMAATSGTVPIGKCRQANVQFLASATSSTYDVAVMPVTANTGTCSRSNCAALLSNEGVYACYQRGRPYWLAWRMHYPQTGEEIIGQANDKLVIERLG